MAEGATKRLAAIGTLVLLVLGFMTFLSLFTYYYGWLPDHRNESVWVFFGSTVQFISASFAALGAAAAIFRLIWWCLATIGVIDPWAEW